MHVVKSGDTLSQIVHRELSGSVWGTRGLIKQVLRLNPQVKDADIIFPGERIILSETASQKIEKNLDQSSLEDESEGHQPENDENGAVHQSSQLIEGVKNKPSSSTPHSPFYLIPYLGVSQLFVKQTTLSPMEETALTLKLDARYFFRKTSLSVGIDGIYSFLPLASSASHMSIRPLSIAFHGIKGIQVSNLWTINLYGGGFYSTTFANDTEFGYRNVAGIEIYPEVIFKFKKFHQAGLAFKFSPFLNGLGMLDLKNRMITFQGEWRFLLHQAKSSKNVLALKLEATDLALYTQGGSVHFQAYHFLIGLIW